MRFFEQQWAMEQFCDRHGPNAKRKKDHWCDKLIFAKWSANKCELISKHKKHRELLCCLSNLFTEKLSHDTFNFDKRQGLCGKISDNTKKCTIVSTITVCLVMFEDNESDDDPSFSSQLCQLWSVKKCPFSVNKQNSASAKESHRWKCNKKTSQQHFPQTSGWQIIETNLTPMTPQLLLFCIAIVSEAGHKPCLIKAGVLQAFDIMCFKTKVQRAKCTLHRDSNQIIAKMFIWGKKKLWHWSDDWMHWLLQILLTVNTECNEHHALEKESLTASLHESPAVDLFSLISCQACNMGNMTIQVCFNLPQQVILQCVKSLIECFALSYILVIHRKACQFLCIDAFKTMTETMMHC